jgi:TolB-like protein
MRLVSELKRRNVFRMAVLYVVTAWLVMQVAEVLVGLGNLPAWIGPTVLGILAIGFPIAMLLSWFYEITPEGISLEKHVEPGASITHITGRRIDFIVIAVLCAALVVFTHDRWWPAGPSARSIAVLPFENQSPDNESVGFLATGIQDGLLTRLSKSDTLKVISRTSVERYRNTSDSVPRIAAELGVRMILEGAVQRAGDQIRVNVQLIDAMTDEHVWAETYDRVLSASNIFMLQSEIVGTIARQLDANLVPDASSKADGMPTQNLAAYTEYLRGMKQTDIESVESMHAAIEHFEAAAELDPEGSVPTSWEGCRPTRVSRWPSRRS